LGRVSRRQAYGNLWGTTLTGRGSTGADDLAGKAAAGARRTDRVSAPLGASKSSTKRRKTHFDCSVSPFDANTESYRHSALLLSGKSGICPYSLHGGPVPRTFRSSPPRAGVMSGGLSFSSIPDYSLPRHSPFLAPSWLQSEIGWLPQALTHLALVQATVGILGIFLSFSLLIAGGEPPKRDSSPQCPPTVPPLPPSTRPGDAPPLRRPSLPQPPLTLPCR